MCQPPIRNSLTSHGNCRKTTIYRVVGWTAAKET
jgi:hypothetical protein